MSSRSRSSGQVLVIILLVMIVGLTVGLFLLGRTTVDVSVSKNVEESARGFNAAEAGIEEAIRDVTTVVVPPVPFASGLTYQVGVTPIVPGGGNFYPELRLKPVQIGKVFNVWLVPHDNTTGDLIEDPAQAYEQLLDICFTSGSPIPALQLTVHYKDAGEYHSVSTGFDPDPSPTRDSNNLQDTEAGVGSCAGTAPNNYNYRAQVNFATTFGINFHAGGPGGPLPLVLRITPLYSPTSIAVIPVGGGLPTQGNEIDSTGHSGDIARTIEVAEQYLVPAPWLDQTLYVSGVSGVTK